MQGREALQQSAPATAPWTPVLLAAGAEPVLAPSGPAAALAASAPAPGPGSHSRAWRAGGSAEDIINAGSRGSDPSSGKLSTAPAPAPYETGQERAATEQAAEKGSHGSASSPRAVPGSAAAIEAGSNASDEVIVGTDDPYARGGHHVLPLVRRRCCHWCIISLLFSVDSDCAEHARLTEDDGPGA